MKKIIILLLAMVLLIPTSVIASDNSTQNDGDSLEITENTTKLFKAIKNKYNGGNSEVNLNAKARNIPILMYHEVGYTPTKEYSDSNYIMKETFENQMFYLVRNGYKTITMSQVYDNWVNGTPLPEKCVVLTFDDGYASHFTFVKDVLDRFNANATFYIVEDRLSYGIKDRNLENLKKLSDAGYEIGVHTYSHPNFSELDYDETYFQISKSKKFLEDNLGIEVKTFSYPFGIVNEYSLNILKDLGFETAVTTKQGIADPQKYGDDSRFLMNRYNIDYNMTLDKFGRILEGK